MNDKAIEEISNNLEYYKKKLDRGARPGDYESGITGDVDIETYIHDVSALLNLILEKRKPLRDEYRSYPYCPRCEAALNTDCGLCDLSYCGACGQGIDWKKD